MVLSDNDETLVCARVFCNIYGITQRGYAGDRPSFNQKRHLLNNSCVTFPVGFTRPLSMQLDRLYLDICNDETHQKIKECNAICRQNDLGK
jgi:hypothetical protein